MKPTGMIRRLDDLGRVVIPKEIRRTNRLGEGTPLEIFTDKDGGIILKKYSPMLELGEFAKQYADVIAQTIGHTVCISDRDQVIACAGSMKKDYQGKGISRELENMILERKALNSNDMTKIALVNSEPDAAGYSAQAVFPIISEGDAIGSVTIFSRERGASFGELEYKSAACAAAFLGRHMEAY